MAWGGHCLATVSSLKFLTLPRVNLNELELVLITLVFPGSPFKGAISVGLGLSHVMNQSTLKPLCSSSVQELERLLRAPVLASSQRPATCMSCPQEVYSLLQRTDKLAFGPQLSIARSRALHLDSLAVSCLWEVCVISYI